MSKLPEIEARRAKLQGEELQTALRIVAFMDLLEKIREAAGKGVDPAALVAQIKRIDPAMLADAGMWLRQLVMERFGAEHKQLDARLQTIAAAAGKACPYTQAEYDAAVAKVGTKQKLIASELKVSNKTVQKYGRPPE